MKRFVFFSFVLTLIMSGMSCNAQSPKSDKKTVSSTDKVEVYYFHYTRRCVTCNLVESETKKALESLYPEQVKSGKVVFLSVNLEEKSSKTVAEKCKATGQSLLVVSGTKRADLTHTGFMYARSQPEKLKAEIKSAIDPLL